MLSKNDNIHLPNVVKWRFKVAKNGNTQVQILQNHT